MEFTVKEARRDAKLMELKGRFERILKDAAEVATEMDVAAGDAGRGAAVFGDRVAGA